MSTPPVLPSPSLRVNDLLFLNEYFRNGQNATQAYRTVHPNVRYNTAQVQSSRLLSKPIVQQAIAQRVQVDGGITKDYVESSLLKYQAWADAKQDYVAGASICMDAAKVAGLITDKREVKTVTPEQSSAILDLVRRTFPVPTPTTRMTLPVAETPADIPASATLSPSAATVNSVVTQFNAHAVTSGDN